MSGTFSSFGSALSALRYSRVAMDTASNNVANANTPGYTRRMAVAQATGAPAVPALWSTWNGAGGGVEVGGIERMVDPLLSARSRTEHASLSFLNTRAASLVRFETTLSEPGENGVAAALSAFKAGWHDVANNPGDEAARSQLIGRANTLVDAIHAQAGAVSTEWRDQRTRLDAVMAEANQVAEDLAGLNKALAAAHNTGTDANTLLDRRDALSLRLADLTGAKTSVNDDTTVTVTLAEATLVARDGTHGELAVPGDPTDSDEIAEHTDVVVQLIGPDGTSGELTNFEAHGEIGGSLRLLEDDLPVYLSGLDDFAAELASDLNTAHQAAFGSDGLNGRPFFGTGTVSATSISVAITDPAHVGASLQGPDADGVASGDATGALEMAALPMGGSTYRSLITNFGVKVASAERVANNQQVLTNQVDATWESLAGVNIDEEMVNLLAAQRAYEGASRVITTLDSVLDTLINRTGITR